MSMGMNPGLSTSGHAGIALHAERGPTDRGPGGRALPVGRLRVSGTVRWLLGASGLLMLGLGALVLTRTITDPQRFPVAHVDVLGTLDFTERSLLRERIETHTRFGFYGLDIDALHRDVEALPWVSSARVGRVWPARVTVEIDEHEPAARWNHDALISKRDVPFNPPQLLPDAERHDTWLRVFADLPRLTGVDGRQQALLDHWRHYSVSLAEKNVSLVALEEDERHSQTLILSNGVRVRLGVAEREQRLERFLDVFDRLVEPLDGQSARFDMRYSNGFAYRGPTT